MKKLLAGVLAGTLVLGSLAVVSADALSDVAGGGDWWANHSASIALVEDQTLTITFTQTTDDTATGNSDTTTYVIYTASVEYDGNGSINNSAGYAECFVGRADCYGWIGIYNTAGYTYGMEPYDFTDKTGITYTSTAPSDWSAWLAGCKAGQESTIEATYADGVVTVVYTIGGATSTAVIPVTVPEGSNVYINLTAEHCAISNIEYSFADVTNDEETGDENDDEDDDESDVDDPNANDEEEHSAADYNTVVDEYTLEDATYGGFWTGFSDGIALTEGTKTVITGTTTSIGTGDVDFTWDNMFCVLFSSADGIVNGEDYIEYLVARADGAYTGVAAGYPGWWTVNYADNVTWTVLSEPDDWDAWLAATNDGAEFTIEALYVNGVVKLTVTCLDASYMLVFTVDDPDAPIYLALSGEYAMISDVVVTVYEASAEEVSGLSNLIGTLGKEGEDDDNGNGSAGEDAATTETAAAVSGVKTADASLLLLIVLALAGCSAIAFVAKKRA